MLKIRLWPVAREGTLALVFLIHIAATSGCSMSWFAFRIRIAILIASNRPDMPLLTIVLVIRHVLAVPAELMFAAV